METQQFLCLCVNLLGLAVVDRVIKRFRRSHVNPELGEDSHLVEVAIVQRVVVEPNHQWSLQNTPNRNQGVKSICNCCTVSPMLIVLVYMQF